jgi:Arc/MetJ-type ribon-helix-helix transcriptional regulator
MATTIAETSLTLTLSPEHAAQVHQLVADGRYASASEAVQHFVYQALDDDLIAARYSPEVRAELQKGMAEAERGEFVPQELTKAFFEDWRRNG